MKIYKVQKFNGNWDSIETLNIDITKWKGNEDVSAFAKLAYTEDALLCRMWAIEKDILATYTPEDLDGAPCEDSCLEIFFSPEQKNIRYFNAETNPNLCLNLGFRTGRQIKVRINPREMWTIDPLEVEGGWGFTHSISLDCLQLFFPEFKLKPGSTRRANFHKCGDKTVKPHYLAWNDITCDYPDCHRPADFGELIFE